MLDITASSFYNGVRTDAGIISNVETCVKVKIDDADTGKDAFFLGTQVQSCVTARSTMHSFVQW